MKKKKNAFTLIELLAVIVILAVILVISIPRILDVIEKSKKYSFKITSQLIADSAEKKYVTNKLNNIDEVITCDSVSKLNKEDYEYCFVKINEEGKATVTIEGKGKFKGMGICNASKETSEISDTCSTSSKYFTYKKIEGGIEITDYNEEGGTVVIIPSIIEGSSVTSIGTNAFRNNQLTSVTIGNSVTSIGNYAFYKNQLTSVTIGNSVTSIGEYAFSSNQLTSVTIPDSVTRVGNFAFYKNQLTSVTIPDSVTSIGAMAFNNNQLPDEEAFIYKRNSDGSIDNTTIISYGGKNKSPIIPNTVKTIGDFAFYNNQLTSVVIPNSVTSIGGSAFQNNQLTSVTIGNNVARIGNYAFYKTSTGNPNLTKIINKTGKSFDWGKIVNGSYGYNFITGTVVNSVGNIEVVAE